ncbi:hypothetical protein LTR56_014309 [Elasticomyces elasticus]|nr:hypothetical protein LTR22_024717 [Elasticomyces elasticus]KAK3636146.1 hypothetical protein LTR56_014309 [Elasticomyces elasticus]KAK4916565.1 hypothetical protein LTR49_015398 [Elasticomyces elasticus]KAK5756198.1 hypothetical protein LTS12_013751 [Elasticomyces elasticus]
MSAPRGGYRRQVKRPGSSDANHASRRVTDNNHNEHWNSERHNMIRAAALRASARPGGPTSSAPATGLKRLNPFSAEAERARKVVKEEPGTATSALFGQTAPHSGAFGGFKFAGKNANSTGTFGKPSLVFPSQPSAYREPTPTAFAPAHMAPRGGRDVGVTSLEIPKRRLLPAELSQPTKALAPRPETYAQQRISALPSRADGEAWIAVSPAEPGKVEWWPLEWYGARTLEGQAKYDYLNRAPPYGVFPDSTEPYWRQDKNGEWFVGPEDGKSWDLVKDASLLQQKIWMEQHGFKQSTQQAAETGVEPSQDSSLAEPHAQPTVLARPLYGEAEIMEQEEAQDLWSTWTSPSQPAVSQPLPAQLGALKPVTPMVPAPAAVGTQEIVPERYRGELPKPVEFYKKHALAFQEYELKMGLKPGIMAVASKHGSAETTELQAMASQLKASDAEKERLKAEKAQLREQVAGCERNLEEQNAAWVEKLEKFRGQAKERNSSQNKLRADLSADNEALRAAWEIEKGKHTAAVVEEAVGDTVGEQTAGYERKLEEQNAAWIEKLQKFRGQAKERNKIQNEQKTDLMAEITALKAAFEMEKGKHTAAVVEETVGGNAEEQSAVVKSE